MRFKKWLAATALLAVVALAVAGCSSSTPAADKTAGSKAEIKIGATAGPHAEVVEAVAKEAKNQGLNIKVIEFSDYITPDKALANGDIDLNSYQHAPFLQNFNNQNKIVLIKKFLASGEEP